MTTPTTFAKFVNEILGLINIIVPTIFAVVFLFLVWKIFDSWVINAADETKRGEGKQYAIVSVIVLVVMIMAWGIVALIRNSIF
jgi:hypothetical protein